MITLGLSKTSKTAAETHFYGKQFGL